MIKEKLNLEVVGQSNDLSFQKKYKDILKRIYKDPSKPKIIHSVCNLLNDLALRFQTPIHKEILSEYSKILFSTTEDEAYRRLFGKGNGYGNKSNSLNKFKLSKNYKEFTQSSFKFNKKMQIITSNHKVFRPNFTANGKINEEMNLNLTNAQKDRQNDSIVWNMNLAKFNF